MACKICSHATKEIVLDKRDIVYDSCINCDFISKKDKYLISEAEEFKIYEFHENSIENKGYVKFLYNFLDKSVFKFFDRNYDSISNSSPKTLDFGSGPTPVLSQILRENHGYDIDIYDYFYSPEKVYLNKKYDLIVCTEVIEHINNPIDYFKLFKSILSKDGIICMMTLFHPRDVDKFKEWYYIRDLSHISFFTRKTFEYIASILKMKAIYCDDERIFCFKNK